jgi:hypothetical protein
MTFGGKPSAKARLLLLVLLLGLASGCKDRQSSIADRVSTNMTSFSQTLKTNHILMVDVSPSMGPYLPALRDSIEAAIQNAQDGDIISVYTFWHQIRPVIEDIEIGNVSREALIQRIREAIIIIDGCTDVTGMLALSHEKMVRSENAHPFHRKMLMIFSDNQHAPFPCAHGGKLSAFEKANLEEKASSVRRMGGWSKYVIYTPEAASKGESFNSIPSDIGAKRVEYTGHGDSRSLHSLIAITKWILILQMIFVVLLFIYFIFRLYKLSRFMFALGLTLFVFMSSVFLVEMLAGIDYLNSSIEYLTGQIINYLSPIIGDHRIVMPLQLTFSIMSYIGLAYLIRRLTRPRMTEAS